MLGFLGPDKVVEFRVAQPAKYDLKIEQHSTVVVLHQPSAVVSAKKKKN